MSPSININISMTPEGAKVSTPVAFAAIDQAQAPLPPLSEAEVSADVSGLATGEGPPPPLEGEASADMAGLATGEGPPPPLAEEANETVPLDAD